MLTRGLPVLLLLARLVVHPDSQSKMWEECILPEGKTPQLAELQWLFALALSTWKKEFQKRGRSGKRRAS